MNVDGMQFMPVLYQRIVGIKGSVDHHDYTINVFVSQGATPDH